MKPFLKSTVVILLAGVLIYISCKKDHSCETCQDANRPPISNAGRDTMIILPVDSVILNGNFSSDPDGKISSYLWTKISGPSSYKINTPSAAATIANQLTEGIYQFQLQITDDGGLYTEDTIVITVNSASTPNRAPVANAGTGQIITQPVNSVNFDGSGSTDPDNNIVRYAWTKISGPPSFHIVNANTVRTQVVNLEQGIYQFELKVIDSGDLFSKDTVQVEVVGIVLSSNGILVPFGTLSIARVGMATGTAANKVLFAGGYTTCGTVGSGICNWFSRVDIYDMTTGVWSTSELSRGQDTYGCRCSRQQDIFRRGLYQF